MTTGRLITNGFAKFLNFRLEQLAAVVHLHPVPVRPNQIVSRMQRMAACCCLVAFVNSLSWFWPLAVFSIAVADGSHSARISTEGCRLSVVLHHEQQDSTSAHGHDHADDHQHGFTADIFMALARDSSSHTDHVIQFATAPMHGAESQPMRPSPPPSSIDVPETPAELAGIMVRCGEVSLHPHPPPVLSAFLQQLRATVLLV